MMPRAFLVALLLVVLAPFAAHALEPERRDVIVVTGRVWDGFAYRETFLPSSSPELRLLGGKDNAITFVRTKEYYWPLSRQVYVDLESEREEVDGTLRILRDGKPVADIGKTPYSIIYPDGAVNGNGQLAWGEEAAKAFADHEANERDFARRFVAAQQAQTAYERKLLETGAARNRGEKVEIVTPPEPMPKPSLRLVTRPTPGFRVDLPPGLYSMALLKDGKEIAGTARELAIVNAEGSRTIVADIIPEERWTRPIASNSPAARVFARPGTVFYATLSEADRYQESDYLRVVTPQADPVDGRTMWVRRKQAGVETLPLSWGHARPDALPLDRLKVEQTDGSGFGYKVRLAKGSEKEDIQAFQIAVPNDAGIRRGWLGLGAEPLNGREIVIVHPRKTSLALVLAFLPLAGWAGLALSRRRKRITA